MIMIIIIIIITIIITFKTLFSKYPFKRPFFPSTFEKEKLGCIRFLFLWLYLHDAQVQQNLGVSSQCWGISLKVTGKRHAKEGEKVRGAIAATRVFLQFSFPCDLEPQNKAKENAYARKYPFAD